nr:obg-like ATPase 1 [Nerophis lumbriciformis]
MEIIHEEPSLKDEEMMVPIIDKLEKTAIRGDDKNLKLNISVLVSHICTINLSEEVYIREKNKWKYPQCCRHSFYRPTLSLRMHAEKIH